MGMIQDALGRLGITEEKEEWPLIQSAVELADSMVTGRNGDILANLKSNARNETSQKHALYVRKINEIQYSLKMGLGYRTSKTNEDDLIAVTLMDLAKGVNSVTATALERAGKYTTSTFAGSFKSGQNEQTERYTAESMFLLLLTDQAIKLLPYTSMEAKACANLELIINVMDLCCERFSCTKINVQAEGDKRINLAIHYPDIMKNFKLLRDDSKEKQSIITETENAVNTLDDEKYQLEINAARLNVYYNDKETAIKIAPAIVKNAILDRCNHINELETHFAKVDLNLDQDIPNIEITRDLEPTHIQGSHTSILSRHTFNELDNNIIIAGAQPSSPISRNRNSFSHNHASQINTQVFDRQSLLSRQYKEPAQFGGGVANSERGSLFPEDSLAATELFYEQSLTEINNAFKDQNIYRKPKHGNSDARVVKGSNKGKYTPPITAQEVILVMHKVQLARASTNKPIANPPFTQVALALTLKTHPVCAKLKSKADKQSFCIEFPQNIEKYITFPTSTKTNKQNSKTINDQIKKAWINYKVVQEYGEDREFIPNGFPRSTLTQDLILVDQAISAQLQAFKNFTLQVGTIGITYEQQSVAYMRYNLTALVNRRNELAKCLSKENQGYDKLDVSKLLQEIKVRNNSVVNNQKLTLNSSESVIECVHNKINQLFHTDNDPITYTKAATNLCVSTKNIMNVLEAIMPEWQSGKCQSEPAYIQGHLEHYKSPDFMNEVAILREEYLARLQNQHDMSMSTMTGAISRVMEGTNELLEVLEDQVAENEKQKKEGLDFKVEIDKEADSINATLHNLTKNLVISIKDDESLANVFIENMNKVKELLTSNMYTGTAHIHIESIVTELNNYLKMARQLTEKVDEDPGENDELNPESHISQNESQESELIRDNLVRLERSQSSEQIKESDGFKHSLVEDLDGAIEFQALQKLTYEQQQMLDNVLSILMQSIKEYPNACEKRLDKCEEQITWIKDLKDNVNTIHRETHVYVETQLKRIAEFKRKTQEMKDTIEHLLQQLSVMSEEVRKLQNINQKLNHENIQHKNELMNKNDQNVSHLETIRILTDKIKILQNSSQASNILDLKFNAPLIPRKEPVQQDNLLPGDEISADLMKDAITHIRANMKGTENRKGSILGFMETYCKGKGQDKISKAAAQQIVNMGIQRRDKYGDGNTSRSGRAFLDYLNGKDGEELKNQMFPYKVPNAITHVDLLSYCNKEDQTQIFKSHKAALYSQYENESGGLTKDSVNMALEL